MVNLVSFCNFVVDVIKNIKFYSLFVKSFTIHRTIKVPGTFKFFTISQFVKDKLNVKVDSSEIQAIHRIPGKIGEARPVIVKLVNSEVKYRIMRAKKNLPKKEKTGR
jgi:hypothetical protein